uniref:Uncharacterized protein n=1 Tax=Periophthalmus magnuspinnatus TaxID=409849 RepID=A0A3B4B5W0_9GOBI
MLCVLFCALTAWTVEVPTKDWELILCKNSLKRGWGQGSCFSPAAPPRSFVSGKHSLNHFPGTFQIGRKDRLWRNLSKMAVRFGKQEFNFFPRTFILPQDIKQLRKAWEDGGTNVSQDKCIHNKCHCIFRCPGRDLSYGNKFDLRIYAYVTSYDPLRIYIFSDGLEL